MPSRKSNERTGGYEMTDLTKLTHEELITKLMVACHEGWPVPMEECDAELLRRLSPQPTGDVAGLLKVIESVKVYLPCDIDRDTFMEDITKLRAAVAGLQADRERLEKLEWYFLQSWDSAGIIMSTVTDKGMKAAYLHKGDNRFTGQGPTCIEAIIAAIDAAREVTDVNG